jgi:hypothetical protein
MGFVEIKMICYADDVLLVAENEDDLWWLLFQFDIACKKHNMIIPTQKTKTMVMVKEPYRCKLLMGEPSNM